MSTSLRFFIISSLICAVAQSGHAKSQRKPSKIDNNPPGDVAVVQQVLPSGTTKVLISDFLHSGYPSTAQTSDAKINITVQVNGKKDQVVYFEVEDPDDKSPYDSDGDPNDNRDPAKTGSVGYQAFQGSCLSATQVVIGSTGTKQGDSPNVWIVPLTLSITNRYAGDNYRINATGVKPDGTEPFRLQESVKNSYASSGVFVAWRRVFLEQNAMFKKGATILGDFTLDSDDNPDTLTITDTGDMTVGAHIEILESNGVTLTSTIRDVSDTSSTIGEVTTHIYQIVVDDLGNDTGVTVQKYSGVKITGNQSTYQVAPLRKLSSVYGSNVDGSDSGCFVEFIDRPELKVTMPNYKEFNLSYDASLFCDHWFKSKPDSANKNIQLLASLYHVRDGDGNGGVPHEAWVATHDFAAGTFYDKVSASHVPHEIGHSTGGLHGGESDPLPSAKRHADRLVNVYTYRDGDICVMSYNTAWENDLSSLCVDCSDYFRQRPDPFP